jgi:hypothetical protein
MDQVAKKIVNRLYSTCNPVSPYSSSNGTQDLIVVEDSNSGIVIYNNQDAGMLMSFLFELDLPHKFRPLLL